MAWCHVCLVCVSYPSQQCVRLWYASPASERTKSEVEVVLRLLLHLLREAVATSASSYHATSAVLSSNHRSAQDLMTEGQEHLETWDTLNNEFNKVQLLWRSGVSVNCWRSWTSSVWPRSVCAGPKRAKRLMR